MVPFLGSIMFEVASAFRKKCTFEVKKICRTRILFMIDEKLNIPPLKFNRFMPNCEIVKNNT